MKFAYIDESGTGDEPFAVMAGVIIDAQRMRPTKDEWISLLMALSEIAKREVKEFHTRDFYAGNKPWRGLAGEKANRNNFRDIRLVSTKTTPYFFHGY